MRFALGLLLLPLLTHAQTTDPALAPRPSTVKSSPEPGATPPTEIVDPNTQAAAKVEAAKTILQGIFEDYSYDPSGKRDPFYPYNAPLLGTSQCGPFEDCEVGALQRFDLDQLKLVGIIWDVKAPKAMFTDPSNKTYVVSEQEKIGRNNGYIAEIREGELVVIEKFYNAGRFTYQTRVLKLEREE